MSRTINIIAITKIYLLTKLHNLHWLSPATSKIILMHNQNYIEETKKIIIEG